MIINSVDLMKSVINLIKNNFKFLNKKEFVF